jgi:hypothetical protein
MTLAIRDVETFDVHPNVTPVVHGEPGYGLVALRDDRAAFVTCLSVKGIVLDVRDAPTGEPAVLEPPSNEPSNERVHERPAFLPARGWLSIAASPSANPSSFMVAGARLIPLTHFGRVGAEGPEAAPFIDEIEGIPVYTCPECRRALKELDGPLPRG